MSSWKTQTTSEFAGYEHICADSITRFARTELPVTRESRPPKRQDSENCDCDPAATHKWSRVDSERKHRGKREGLRPFSCRILSCSIGYIRSPKRCRLHFCYQKHWTYRRNRLKSRCRPSPIAAGYRSPKTQMPTPPPRSLERIEVLDGSHMVQSQ